MREIHIALSGCPSRPPRVTSVISKSCLPRECFICGLLHVSKVVFDATGETSPHGCRPAFLDKVPISCRCFRSWKFVFCSSILPQKKDVSESLDPPAWSLSSLSGKHQLTLSRKRLVQRSEFMF